MMRHEADQAMGLISEVKGIKPVYTVYCIPYSVSIRILYHLIPSYTASKEPRERKLRNEVLCMTQFFSGGGWLDGTILAQANPTWICLLQGGLCAAAWVAMWPPAAVSTVGDVLAFYALPSHVWEAFCGAVGDPGDDMRVLASMPAPMLVEGVMAARTTGGRRLTAVEAIQVGMTYRACHRLVRLMAGGSQSTWKDPGPWAATSSTSSTALEGTTSQGSPG